MASLCGMDVHVSDFSDETTRPKDMFFFFLKVAYLPSMKIVQGMQIYLFVCLLEPLRYPPPPPPPHPKYENFNTLSQFSQ